MSAKKLSEFEASMMKTYRKKSMASDTEETRVRYRRARSQTRAEEITTKEEKNRKSQPDKSIHKPRDSLFSWSSGFEDFTGLVNWGFLLLTMGGVRLLLENFIKYGIRIDPMQWIIVLTGRDEGHGHPSVILVLYSFVPVLLCLLFEKALAKEYIAETPGIFAQVANIVVLIFLPMVIIYVRGHAFSLMGAMSVCFLFSVLFMKLWSYVQVNAWCRRAREADQSKPRHRSSSISIAELQSEERNGAAGHNDSDESVPELVHYPNNLTASDLIYFLCAPTLCYELNFPRTTRIRMRFLLKRLLEVIIGTHIVLGLFQQWMIPSVKNSLIPFSNMDVAKATERLLKLAIPNHFMWLCFFYLTFHSFFNLTGELLHFADRNFYNDWWNSTNIDRFWRTWNMPVHRWCVRHVYIPIVDLGYSRTTASLVVFFISAFFHEYLVSVPLKMFKIWAFMGMMSQLPLSYVSNYVEKHFGGRWGNVIVWASLILGQPLAILMYYHDYIVENYNSVLTGGLES